MKLFLYQGKKENYVKIKLLMVFAGIFVLAGCSSLYYGAMEKAGVHKRDIMVDRVKNRPEIPKREDPTCTCGKLPASMASPK